MAGETVPEFVVLIRFVPLILLSSVVIAQTGENSEGPFAALAQGLSVDSSTALPGGDAATLVFHGTEFTTTSPTPWVVNPSFPTLPDLAALPFMLVPGLDVDALSMGNDSIASSPTGIMTVGAGAVESATIATKAAAIVARRHRVLPRQRQLFSERHRLLSRLHQSWQWC